MGIANDFTTPAGAILCLEDAYRAKDIEAAVACKDFGFEALLMFEELKKGHAKKQDSRRIAELANVLEMTFRKQIAEKGFADMSGVESSFPLVEPFSEGVVLVTEVCRYPGGGTSRQRVLVGQTDEGWRVLNPLPDA